MDALVHVALLEARLGRSLEGLDKQRAEELLKDASAAVRLYTGQILSRETSTVRFEPNRYANRWGINLPQWPVVSIDAVVNDDAEPVELNWITGPFLLTTSPLTVTYTHGYDPIPDGIVAVVCQIVRRAFETLSETVGLTSENESLGSYSHGVTYGAAAGAGPVGMLLDEKRMLTFYRRPAAPISMLPARDVRSSILTDFA